jgi:hypothetical protein
LTSEARSALHRLAPAKLSELPRDTEHLATLGHLSRAAVLLEARDYAEALLALLMPHSQWFAASNVGAALGSVPSVMGLLAHALGQAQSAREHLEAGLRLDEQAGLVTCAHQARLCLERWR